MSLKKSVYSLIDGERGTHKADAYVDILISGLIMLNVVAVFLESYQEIDELYGTHFRIFEVFSIIVFSIEYIARVWTADLLYEHLPKTKARLKFIFSFFGLIDILAIMPFFLPFFFKIDLRIMRALRLLRLLRIFKLGRHSRSMRMVGDVLKDTRYDLMVTMFVTCILLIMASVLMYNIEHAAQPDKFENIGQSLWWAIATLTTVGYGDIFPITAMGKLLSGVIALLGVGIVALPTGIISSTFVEKIRERKKLERKHKKHPDVCPCCDRPL
ncbi:MAG: ion transporter [Bacteroidia bacterium]